MKNLRRLFKKKSRGIFYFIIPSLLLILALIFVSGWFRFSQEQNDSLPVTPNRVITIAEPFTAEFYFNDEFGTNIFSDSVIKAINEAQKTVEVAVFSMDDERIKQALYEAAKRGVEVRLIFSSERALGHDQIFGQLPLNVSRQDILSDDQSAQGYMHHKFMIVDRGEAGAKLFFGSYNFTLLQEKYDPSFLMLTMRPEIINVFGEEFDYLRQNIHSSQKNNLRSPWAALIKYPEGDLEIWFGPNPKGAGLQPRMIELITKASKNLRALIWNLTDDYLAQTLALKAQNIPVTIVTDDANFSGPDSAFPVLLTEKARRDLDKLEIVTDEARTKEVIEKFQEKDFNSFLHHHLLLVDDSLAIFGTNNWSTAGFFRNDESIMISNIPLVVQAFQKTFLNNYEKNKN